MSGRHSTTNPTSSQGRPGLPGVTRSGRAARPVGLERVTHRLESHRTGLRRAAGGFAAMAVVGASLSLAASPGEAVGDTASVAAASKPAFGGYASTGSASPLKLEIYEPTIPLPAEPQLELSVGYSAVAADATSTRSRASYLWPGAPVGEGYQTIIDTLLKPLGLPPGTGGESYPVQVNAQWPNGPEAEADEPAPGMIQRAVAGESVSRADNGVSTDGETKDGDTPAEGGGTDSPLPGLPGVPGLPGLSGLSGLTDSLTGATKTGSTKTGSTRTGSTKAPAAAPVLPDPLSALVDVGGFSSISRTDNRKLATVNSRAQATDITLLGGVATIEGVTTVSSASSNGKVGTPVGKAAFGDIVVAGQRFTYGPDGFEAAGTAIPIPGLPAQGGALLKELGITISVPKPIYTKQGDAASVTMPGLKIELDLKKLRGRDGGLSNTLNDVLGQLPAELDPVKSPLQAAIYAAPRMVVYLGTSFAGVDTSPVFEPPPITDPQPSETAAPTEDATTAPVTPDDPGTGGGDTGTTTPVDTPSDPTVPVVDQEPVVQEEAPATGEAISPVVNNTPPGLPPLLSFPGLLLYGGLLGAAAAGFFVRRLGALALGAGGSCPHGLTSGLPDLRKV